MSRISIIVPAFNEEIYIGDCLDGLLSLRKDNVSLDIIVVDNGSADKTVEITEGKGVRVIVKPGISISALRNAGGSVTGGEYLGFVDADCIVSPDWAEKAISTFEREGQTAGVVGSHYLDPPESGWIQKAWSLQEGDRANPDGDTRWLPGGNMLVRRKVFEMVAGFNEELFTNEDVEFCERVRAAGYRVIKDRGVPCVHMKYTRTLGHFFRRQRWHGRGAWDLFWNSLPKIRNGKVAAYSFWFILSLVVMMIGLEETLREGDLSPLTYLSVVGMLFPSGILAFTTSRRNGNFEFLGKLSVLYFVYGIARSASLLDFIQGRR